MRNLVPPVTVHLQPHADVAERVLAPGDPGRALRLAQWLLEKPRMLNHHRGLWGYTGMAADGRPLTIQSTGLGGPSAAIVGEELVRLGARRIVRVGTCRSVGGRTDLGDLVVAREVLAEDGASRALGAADRVVPDGVLTAALESAAGAGSTIVSSDLFYGRDEAGAARWIAAGAVAVDLEAAAVLAVAAAHGVAAACVLLVTGADGERIGTDALAEGEQAIGRAGLAALGG